MINFTLNLSNVDGQFASDLRLSLILEFVVLIYLILILYIALSYKCTKSSVFPEV